MRAVVRIDYSRLRVAIVTAALAVSAAPAALSAHHSHPLFYDQCHSLTFEGRVGRVQWKNPHTIVDVDTDEGTTYHVEWMAAQALTSRVAGAQAAMTVGARVVVTAHPSRGAAAIRASFPELTGDPVPNTVDPTSIRRPDESFTWTVTPAVVPPVCGDR